jgi:hypothetical protein
MKKRIEHLETNGFHKAHMSAMACHSNQGRHLTLYFLELDGGALFIEKYPDNY